MKKALLIGINYIDYGGNIQLKGCINDVKLIKNMLVNDLSFNERDIIVLTDDNKDANLKPTTMNIYNTLKNIVSNSNEYTEFWFHYSGHGSYLTDNNNEEIDGKDEIIIPCDYKEFGVIDDDILRYLINQIKCRTFMVYDCCHSGSITDLPHQYIYKNNNFEYIKQNNFSCENKNIFMISGCLDPQLSYGLYDFNTNSYIGACTHSLIDTLKKYNYNLTLENLLKNMNIWMHNNNSNQSPSLSSTNTDILNIHFLDVIKLHNKEPISELEKVRIENKILKNKIKELEKLLKKNNIIKSFFYKNIYLT
jgi:hypothetical protein